MNQYPAKPMMDQMAQYGRYGDSMLVHMNPIEVAGIASLSPTGSLTINPVTGQPEAFLPFLAPALGLLGGHLGLGVLGSAALTGIGTAAITGDLKRGLVAGLTSGFASGLGKGLGELMQGSEAGIEAATTGIADGVDTALIGSQDALSQAAIDLGGTDYLGELSGLQSQLNVAGVPTGQAGSAFSEYADIQSQISDAMTSTPAVTDQLTARGVDYQLPGEVGQKAQLGAENIVDKVGTLGQVYGAGTGAAMLEGYDLEEERMAEARRMEEEKEKERAEAYADLQYGYAMAQPNVSRGFSPYRSQMSRRTYNYAAPGMAEGGLTGGPEMQLIQRMADGGTTDYSALNTAAMLQSLYQQGLATGTIPEGTSYADWISSIEAPAATTSTADTAEEAAAAGIASVYRKFESLDEEGIDKLTPGYWAIKQGLDPKDSQEYKALENASRGDPLTATQQDALERYYNRREALRVQREQAIEAAAPEEASPQAQYLQNAMRKSGLFGYQGQFSGIDPVEIQARLREEFKVAPPTDYMTGFEPEFQYFQADPNAPFIPSRAYRPITEGVESEGPYFDPILDRTNYLNQLREYYRTLASYTPGAVVEEPAPDTGAGDTDTVGTDTDETAGTTPTGGETVDVGTGTSPTGTQPVTPPSGTTDTTPSVGGTDAVPDVVYDSNRMQMGWWWNSQYGRWEPAYEGDESVWGGAPFVDVMDSYEIPTWTPGGDVPSSTQSESAQRPENMWNITQGNGRGGEPAPFYAVENGRVMKYMILPTHWATAKDHNTLQVHPDARGYITSVETVGVAGDQPFVIPGSVGGYGEGIYYRDGGLYNFASAGTLENIRRRGENDPGQTPWGVHPDMLSGAEKLRMALSVPGGSIPGAGGPNRYISDYHSGKDASSKFSAGQYATEANLTGDDWDMLTMLRETQFKTLPDGRVVEVGSRFDPDAVARGWYESGFGNQGDLGWTPQAGSEPTDAAMPDMTPPAQGPSRWQDLTIEGAPRIYDQYKYSDDQTSAYVPGLGMMSAEDIDKMIRFNKREYAEGGRTLVSSLGQVQTPAGGIAEVDSQFAGTPSEQEVSMLASALMGEAEGADQIIQMFLDKYGPDIFNQIRDMILKLMTPDAQTQGMIEGQGGGMDDMVPGMIGSSQPVAVSPGEYIIPADVVSDLGDGSSDAGANELDRMLERVRMARGGTAEQPPAINARRVMPA